MVLRLTLAFAIAVLVVGCGGATSPGGGRDGGGGNAGASGTGGGSAGASGAGGGSAGTSGTGGGSAGSAGASDAGGGSAGAAGAGGASGAAGMDAAGDQATLDGGDGAVDGAGDAVCMPLEQPLSGKPDILLLLDASASMNNDELDQTCTGGCGARSKWAQAIAAVDQVVAATDSQVNWGLKLFSEGTGCSVATSVNVPIGPMNASAVMAIIAGRTDIAGGLANGGSHTPTRASEAAASAYLSTVTDGNPRFILLATDGLPNCPGGSGLNPSADDSPGAIQAVVDAQAAGVGTFVVGIGGTLATADLTLNQMAAAGGYPRTDAPLYYPTTSTSDLVAALNQAAAIARNCRFTVADPPGFSRDAIDVSGDGAPIARDPTHGSGWDYSDASHATIDLYGATCAAVMTGAVTHVSVVFRCPPSG
jgi:hypothetical protein